MAPGYRPSSREPRGRWARHIHAVRKERGWSQTRGFEAVREGLGLGAKSRAAYIPLDEGRREPSPAEAEALAAVYGWPSDEPETQETAAPEGTAALVEAVREQTRELVRAIAARDDVIRELLAELAHYRQQTVAAQTIERSLIEALPEALARALAAMRADDPEPGVPGPPALRVRPG